MEYLLFEDVEHEFPNQPQDLLFLEEHDTLPRQWAVDSFDSTWRARMEGVIGRYQSVSIWDLPEFAEKAEEQGYRLVFLDDPQPVLDWLASLSQPPPVSVNSNFEGTINGFLPFQAQAVNFGLSNERAVYFNHDTGLGKTVLIEGMILAKQDWFDICLYCVRRRNLEPARRKLLAHTGLEATVIDGTKAQRRKLWQQGPIFLMTAEKYREDQEILEELVTDKNVLAIFDEMPMKYANRANQVYRATAGVFYTSHVIGRAGRTKGKPLYYPQYGKERPKGVFFVAACADLMINSPEDHYNVVRLMDPRIYGSIQQFEKNFVKARDPWGAVTKWKNLSYFGALSAHLIHYKSKDDPDVINQFPAKAEPDLVACTLDPNSAHLYSVLQDEYTKLVRQQRTVLKRTDILAAIGVFQMICNNPRGVLVSAQHYDDYQAERTMWIRMNHPRPNAIKEYDRKHRRGSEVAWKLRMLVGDDSRFTDADGRGNLVHPKLVKLREYIDEHDDKMIVFTTANETLMPFLEEWLQKWGVNYVTFHGEQSNKEAQAAYDAFRSDPDVKVFLSNDSGSDSIDLPEASLTIHYDHPYTATKQGQRENRQDRIDSEKEEVKVVTFYCPSTVEVRKLEIIEKKKDLAAIMRGDIMEQSAELGNKDLLYILLG